MEQEAIVARVEGDQAYIEVDGEGSGCGRCHEAGGCRSGIFSRMFRPGPRQFRIPNSIGAAPGERVIVSVADGATLRAALLVYVLPVLGLIAGALVGVSVAGHGAQADAAALLGALGGFAAGVLPGLVLRKASTGRAMQPVLLRRSSGVRVAKEACR